VLSLFGVVTAVTWDRDGAVVSTTNVLTLNALLAFPKESVTVMVQLLYVSSLKVLNVMLLLPEEAEVVELLQLPP